MGPLTALQREGPGPPHHRCRHELNCMTTGWKVLVRQLIKGKARRHQWSGR